MARVFETVFKLFFATVILMALAGCASFTMRNSAENKRGWTLSVGSPLTVSFSTWAQQEGDGETGWSEWHVETVPLNTGE